MMDQTEARAIEDEAARAVAAFSEAATSIDPYLWAFGSHRVSGGYFDRAGRRISMAVWGWLSERPDYRRIALDAIGPCHVSTVWLGIDHGFGHAGPVIFETMVFSNDETWSPEWGRHFHEELGIQRRYCTEAEARAGHAEVVEALAGLAATIEGLG